MAVLLSGHRGQLMAAKMAMSDMAFDVMLDTGIRVEALPVWESERAMDSSKLLYKAGDVDGACNRAYYAMFDAAKAILLATVPTD